MTITYEIFEAEGLIKELWLGDISIADVRQHWQSLLTDKRALTHRKGLSDLRKATFKFSNDDLALAVLEVAEPMLEGETWVSAIVVLTHDDKFDLPMLAGALSTDAFYVGALGSRRNQQRRNDLLREAGGPDASIERIAGPCGLDLGAESSAETALSMLAEIVAVRMGRAGGPLRNASKRIHAEPLAGKK